MNLENNSIKFKFILPIYELNFWYSENLNSEEYREHTEEYFEAPEDENYNGYTDYYEGNISIRLQTFAYHTLAHEIYHATTKALEYVNVKDEEAHAYLIGWLMKEILAYRNAYIK